MLTIRFSRGKKIYTISIRFIDCECKREIKDTNWITLKQTDNVMTRKEKKKKRQITMHNTHNSKLKNKNLTKQFEMITGTPESLEDTALLQEHIATVV